MTHTSTEQQIAAAWNAQADELNQWSELDMQEKIEWAAKWGASQARVPLSDEQVDALARSVFGWTDRATKVLVKTTEAFLTGAIAEIPASGAAAIALEDVGIKVAHLVITQEKQG